MDLHKSLSNNQDENQSLDDIDEVYQPKLSLKQNLERWIRTGSVYLGLLLLASAYSNWQPMFQLLDALGSYTNLCPVENQNLLGVGHCDKQYDYLAQIYSIAGNMAYVVGLFAGIIMDAVGGTATLFSGVLAVFGGWIMIVVSTPQINLVWPGMILLGCAENLLGFPGFLMAEFWPGIQDTCASLCIAMQMLSSWVPALIWTLVKNKTDPKSATKNAIWIYLGVSILPAIGMILSVPGRKSSTMIARKNTKEATLSPTESPEKNWKTKAYWCLVFRLISSVEFILFTIWYILITLGYQFYNTKIPQHAGDEAAFISELIGWLNPFRALIGPILGFISDYVGPFPMILLDNLMIVLAFAVALIRKDWAYNTSVVFYIIGRSYVFTTKYIFIQRFYPAEHFGKLSGILSLMGGLFGFLNAWFQVIPIDTEYTFAGSAVIMFVSIVIPVHLMRKANAKIKQEEELNEETLSIAYLESFP